MSLFLIGQASIDASSLLRIATHVGTPLAILGLVVALAFLAYSRKLNKEEKTLEQLPPEDRAKQVDEYLTRYGLSATKLTRDQKFNLIKQELETRSKNGRFYALLAAFVFIFCFGIAAWGFANTRSPNETVTPPPEQFQVSWFESYANPGLEDRFFGSLQDIERQSRAWMKTTEQGALSELSINQADAKLMWGFTSPPFPNSHGAFRVYVNLGTEANAVVYLYRMRFENGKYTHEALERNGKQGAKPEYPFEASSSTTGDVLVVFVAMTKDSYDGITRDPKVLIRSQQLNP